MSLRNKEYTQKLLKKLKNKKSKNYQKKKKTSSSLRKRDLLNQSKNQDKISFTIIKLLKRKDKNKKLKNKL